MAFSRQLHIYTERTEYWQRLCYRGNGYNNNWPKDVAVNTHTARAVLSLVVSEYTNIFELKHNGMTTPKFIRTTIRLFAQGHTGRPRGTHYAYCVSERCNGYE
jgi:hypothetical protein